MSRNILRNIDPGYATMLLFRASSRESALLRKTKLSDETIITRLFSFITSIISDIAFVESLNRIPSKITSYYRRIERMVTKLILLILNREGLQKSTPSDKRDATRLAFSKAEQVIKTANTQSLEPQFKLFLSDATSAEFVKRVMVKDKLIWSITPINSTDILKKHNKSDNVCAFTPSKEPPLFNMYTKSNEVIVDRLFRTLPASIKLVKYEGVNRNIKINPIEVLYCIGNTTILLDTVGSLKIAGVDRLESDYTIEPLKLGSDKLRVSINRIATIKNSPPKKEKARPLPVLQYNISRSTQRKHGMVCTTDGVNWIAVDYRIYDAKGGNKTRSKINQKLLSSYLTLKIEKNGRTLIPYFSYYTVIETPVLKTLIRTMLCALSYCRSLLPGGGKIGTKYSQYVRDLRMYKSQIDISTNIVTLRPAYNRISKLSLDFREWKSIVKTPALQKLTPFTIFDKYTFLDAKTTPAYSKLSEKENVVKYTDRNGWFYYNMEYKDLQNSPKAIPSHMSKSLFVREDLDTVNLSGIIVSMYGDIYSIYKETPTGKNFEIVSNVDDQFQKTSIYNLIINFGLYRSTAYKHYNNIKKYYTYMTSVNTAIKILSKISVSYQKIEQSPPPDKNSEEILDDSETIDKKPIVITETSFISVFPGPGDTNISKIESNGLALLSFALKIRSTYNGGDGIKGGLKAQDKYDRLLKLFSSVPTILHNFFTLTSYQTRSTGLRKDIVRGCEIAISISKTIGRIIDNVNKIALSNRKVKYSDVFNTWIELVKNRREIVVNKINKTEWFKKSPLNDIK